MKKKLNTYLSIIVATLAVGSISQARVVLTATLKDRPVVLTCERMDGLIVVRVCQPDSTNEQLNDVNGCSILEGMKDLISKESEFREFEKTRIESGINPNDLNLKDKVLLLNARSEIQNSDTQMKAKKQIDGILESLFSKMDGAPVKRRLQEENEGSTIAFRLLSFLALNDDVNMLADAELQEALQQIDQAQEAKERAQRFEEGAKLLQQHTQEVKAAIRCNENPRKFGVNSTDDCPLVKTR